MTHVGEAGHRGERARSDCWVRVEPRADGGVELCVKSKVEAMYGEAVRGTCRAALDGLGVRHAAVTVEDQGALDFVLAARIEAAVKRAGLGGSATFLPAPGPGCDAPAPRASASAASRLYLPGNEPKFMLNAGLHEPDGVILDLEDSVAPAEKDAARAPGAQRPPGRRFRRRERMVRINQGERGLEDLDAVVPQNVHVILIPKVERRPSR